MTIRAVFPVFAVILFAFHSPIAAQRRNKKTSSSPRKTPKSKPVDDGMYRRAGRHVRSDHDRDLALIAILQADGFPTETFAKHVGHKVTVRGTAIPGGTHPTFKVRSIAAISDTCAPQHQSW